ncbi:efflux RND transporter periplasmic adaptor subunit [soil metagenome]
MSVHLRIADRIRRDCWVSVAGALLLTGVIGCQSESSAGKAETPAPIVTVATPLKEIVQKYEFFTGRTEAPDKVEIRAQVSGYLIKVLFTPGTIVKKDTPLFEIDPAPFQVDLEKANAQLALAQAREKQMLAEFDRMDDLFKKGSASKAEWDKAVANKNEATAAIKGADAQISGAKLNLAFTKINAPLTGMIGDKLVSEGNLIAGGQGNTTLLTTIVSVDPMNVAFDVDENTIERFQDAERRGVIKTANRGAFAVELGLSLHNSGYPLKGIINFSNNQFDQKTGTVKVKASVENPEPKIGKRLMVPGMFVRVRVPFGEPVESMLVPESAMMSDLGQKYIYAVGPDNKAQRLDITTGPTVNGNVVVEVVRVAGKAEPLKPDARIIVTGVQRVQPGKIVDPKPAPAK